MSEMKYLTRNYEISVWTLQDDYITILGASDSKNRGRIQNAEMKLVNDGTQDLTFQIPMYLDNGVTREINPVWNNINNAQTIVGMRKIKVIFNKNTDVKRVFEFLITKVNKIHENDKPYCEVSCEGLPFHELGKIGYKIELSTDTLVNEDTKWYNSRSSYNSDSEWYADEPRPTIDYWMNKVLKIPKRSSQGIINAQTWYYDVQMNWNDYTHIGDIPRENDKIYEEEITTAWNSELLPKDSTSVLSYKEKTRIIDEKESNIYNLTQKLAETFGVFCRYDYEYDDNYHIKSRTIVFYNTGIYDNGTQFSFTYPYSSTKIEREDDCTDIVTKMYVTAIDDQSTASGLVTIINSEVNKTREDYLLNFDYLHEIKTISDEQYEAVHQYEVNIRETNDSLAPLQEQLLVVSDKLPKVEALLTTARNAKSLDAERISNASALAKALDMSDEAPDGYIHVEGQNAKAVALLEYDENSYYFNAPEKGIVANSVVIYTKNWNGNGSLYTDNSFKVGVPQYDEFGDFIKMVSIPKNLFSKQLIYITFKYSPKLYYEKIEQVWRERLAKDEADIAIYSAEYNNLTIRKTSLETQIDTIINTQADLRKEFERTMGPALREGYWTPENYDTTTGEKYVDFLSLDYTDNFQPLTVTGNTEHASFIWDTEIFEDEQKATYKLGVNLTEIPYPYIVLTDSQVGFIKDNIDKSVGILYYDYKEDNTTPASDPRYYRCLAIGASAIVQCIREDNQIKFALLLIGTTTFTTEEINFMKSNDGQAKIGYLTTTVTNNGNFTITPTIHSSITSNQWHTDSAAQIVYPRCKISSLTLKNNETDLTLSYQYNPLSNYEDYYVFQRIDQVNSIYQSNYYITLKPMTLFNAGTLRGLIGIRYSLSNASTAIYIDAREILKENSKPKVTYIIDPNILYENFTYTAYNALNVITFINDYELQFDGARGYISTLNLNLDFPNEDTIEIKNYKNKFEDLFSTIVAQTQAMEKNEAVISAMTKIVSADGSISAPALEGALRKVDLNYQFNQGKLTISEKEGIWGTSDDGVVAFRGGGIFTSTQRDEDGNWIWNTGIVPQGINANLITSGQLDTNKIKVYSGDRIRFQLNGDGLFAYKSLFSDYEVLDNGESSIWKSEYQNLVSAKQNEDVDYAQYVVMNEDGLFLCARQGALVVNNSGDNFIKVGYNSSNVAIFNFPKVLNRVSISWDGLTLRNWADTKVFYANAETGDLTLDGTIYARALYIGNNGTQIDTYLDNSMDTHVYSFGATIDGFHSAYESTTGTLTTKTSLIQNDGQINLSACTFDSIGVKNNSAIQITPTNITIGTGGTITLQANAISMSAVNGLGTALGEKYTVINNISITGNGVDVVGKRVYIGTTTYTNRGTENYVEITSSGILLNGETTLTGKLNGATGSFSGSVTASDGNIAGWKIGSSAFTRTYNNTSAYKVTVGEAGNYIGLWMGGESAHNAPLSMVVNRTFNDLTQAYSFTAPAYYWSWWENGQWHYVNIDLNYIWNNYRSFFGKPFTV